MNPHHQGTGFLPSTISTPNSQSLIPITKPSNSTLAPSTSIPLKNPSTKKILINHLRTLHATLLQRHKLITGFDLRLYKSQEHVVVNFAECLLGLDYSAEVTRGEIGNEAYYAELHQVPVWEIRGKICEVEDMIKRLGGFMGGTMGVGERDGARENEGDADGSQDREEYRREETGGSWLSRKVLGVKG